MGQALKIGKIINSKGESVTSLVLEPQGIAHLISEEKISLPGNTCAFAHVLTRLCNKGLLTLNIGVIDPGWSNYVSTSILNFSSERRLLEVGNPFIRLTYHKIPEIDPTNPQVPLCASSSIRKNYSNESYVSQVKERSVGDFGKHFLNIRQLVGKASKKENGRLRDSLLKYIPIAAFSLAIFALLVTIGVATTVRISTSSSENSSEEMKHLLQELGRLEAKIDENERRQDASQSARPEGTILPPTAATSAPAAENQTGAKNESDVQHQ